MALCMPICRPCLSRIAPIGSSAGSVLLRRYAHTPSTDPVSRAATAHTPEPPTPQPERPSNNKSSKRRFPALALSALGLPLGWYLSQQYRDSQSALPHDPSQFVQYTLVAKETVSSTCAIFSLKPSSKLSIPITASDSEWAINSVEFKQPQLQIVRSYTCLPPRTDQATDELRFLIRRETNGEVSNYLHRLPLGSQIEVRGPYVEYAVPADVGSAIFLAGGTGIVPALQAADILDGEANLHVLWASRRREDCLGGQNDTAIKASSLSWWPRTGDQLSASMTASDAAQEQPERGAIVAQLESLKRSFASAADRDATKLVVDYFVDEEGTSITPSLLKDAIEKQTRMPRHENALRKVIFVSGPTGFISHWAGPKQWAQGREIQGPLGGVLSTLQLQGWEVVKL